MKTPGAIGAVSIQPDLSQIKVGSHPQDGSLRWVGVPVAGGTANSVDHGHHSIFIHSVHRDSRGVEGAVGFMFQVSEDGHGTIEAPEQK